MKRRLSLGMKLFAVSLGLAPAVLGYPVPTPGSENLRKLVQGATVVCTGTVVRTASQGWTTGMVGSDAMAVQSVLASVQVDRVYKGTVPQSELRVRFEVPQANLPYLSLEAGEYVLLFLVPEGDEFRFSDRWFGKLEMSPLAAGGVRPAAPESALEADLKAGLRDPHRRLMLANLRLLGSLRKLSSVREITELLPAADPEVEGSVYLALLKVGDGSHLEDAGTFLERPSDNAVLVWLKTRIGHAIAELRDARNTKVLLSFLHSREVLLRRSSVRALRKMQIPATVPSLIARLDDRDREVRYNAVLAMAAIEGKSAPWAFATDIYEEREAECIKLWKEWWVSEGFGKYVGRNRAPGLKD